MGDAADDMMYQAEQHDRYYSTPRPSDERSWLAVTARTLNTPHAGAVGRPAPDRAAVLRAEIRRAQDELHRLESVPDPAGMEPGTVLRYRRWFDGGPADGYVFVALLAPADAAVPGPSRWYLTGRRERPLTHAEFREVLAAAVEGSIETLVPMPVTPPWGRTEERLALADELEAWAGDGDLDTIVDLIAAWRSR